MPDVILLPRLDATGPGLRPLAAQEALDMLIAYLETEKTEGDESARSDYLKSVQVILGWHSPRPKQLGRPSRFVTADGRFITDHGEPGVHLLLPDPDRKGLGAAAAKEYRRALDTLEGLCREKLGLTSESRHDPRQRPTADILSCMQTAGLADYISRLLIAGLPEEYPVGCLDEEFMIAVLDATPEQIEPVYEVLLQALYQPRVLVGLSQDGRSHYFFYVQTSNRALEPLAQLAVKECHVLHAWLREIKNQPRLVFLPREARPGDQTFERFDRLLRDVPGLWDIDLAAARQHSLLLAIVPSPWGDTGEYCTFPLSDLTLTWYSKFREIQVELRETHDAAEVVPNLQKRISDGEPPWGYRLSLRKVDDHRYDPQLLENKIRNLTVQKNQIEYQIEVLRSRKPMEPRLFRFTQRQLPVLADLLMSYPEKDLCQDKIKYLFHGSREDAAGYHYLLIENGDTDREDTDPLIFWRHREPPAIEYWLDPFYRRPAQFTGGWLRDRPSIMVPRGRALYPPFITPDMKDIEARLDVFCARFEPPEKERISGISLENRIYVFGGEGVQPVLSVLNHAAFRPLRDRLSWLNDNLQLHETVTTENLIRALASQDTAKQLWTTFAEQSQAAAEAFRLQADSARAKMAGQLEETTREVEANTAKLAKAIEIRKDEILRLNQKLSQLITRLSGMKTLVADTDGIKKQVEDTLESSARSTNELDRDVQAQIQRSKAAQASIPPQVADQIRALDALTEELNRQLDELRWL